MVFEVRLYLPDESPGVENRYCSVTYVLTDVAKHAFRWLNGTSLNNRIVVSKLPEGMRLELRTVVSQMYVNDAVHPNPMLRFNTSSFAGPQESIIEDPLVHSLKTMPNKDFRPDDSRFSSLLNPVHYYYDDPPCEGSDTDYTTEYMTYLGDAMLFSNELWSTQSPPPKWENEAISARRWDISESTKPKAKHYYFGQLPYADPDPAYLQNWVFGHFTQWEHYGCAHCGFLLEPCFH
ncbi:unnamed protein product [Acanthoscelides obtectus]|uniref:Uncharacterized protein n=1 Tax=Acanthoscelides obtectus TaxID=200917 RepID=A0A9P0K2R7_ACAOB|nr:unnamed protein product [Acanthoscelides obtectus]CAK1640380.1 hypothetical protein AOBTE_LOCUS11685 [Acanthoscelides obtectus]